MQIENNFTNKLNIKSISSKRLNWSNSASALDLLLQEYDCWKWSANLSIMTLLSTQPSTWEQVSAIQT